MFCWQNICDFVQGDHFVLNGAKNWITNSPIADVCLVWAKTSTDNKVPSVEPSTRTCRSVPRQVRGFLVERGMEDL